MDGLYILPKLKSKRKARPQQMNKNPPDNSHLKAKIEQDKRSGVIHFTTTKLMVLLGEWRSLMSSIHANTMDAIRVKYELHNKQLSKTNHRQVAAIYTRYREAIHIECAQLKDGLAKGSNFDMLNDALAEAKQLEALADALTEKHAKSVSKGNVVFVESL